MTDQQQPLSEPDRGDRPPPAAADIVDDANNQAAPRQPDADDTVGTGTSIALGCIAGTLLLVVIALIYLLVVWLIG